MSVQLPQPGVEIIQEFQTASPTVITPVLVPNIVGVAKQVVGLNVSDGAGGSDLNPDALIQMQAQFTTIAAVGNPAVYGGLNGLFLAVSVNNGPVITVTFVDTGSGLTPSSVVAQVLNAFNLQGVTSVTAELVGTAQWQMRTIGVGDFQQIVIASTTSPAVASAFGIGIGKTYRGLGAYNQYVVEIPRPAFPDPRDNLNELAVEDATIRTFLALGSSGDVRESLRTQAFLRNGEVYDAAVITGNVDLTGLSLPAAVGTNTLILSIGGSAQTVTYANPANPAAVVSQTTAGLTGAVASLAPGNFLRITTTALGSSASITVTGGTAAATLGMTGLTDTGESISAIDDGDGDSLTSLLRFPLENFSTAATAAVVTASVAMTNPASGSTLILSDGQQTQTIVFGTVANITAAITQINAVVGSAAGGRITASDAGGGLMRFTHSLSGTDSVIKILGGTALTNMDSGGSPTMVVGTYRGVPNVPLPGDELWIDGVQFANVSSVTPGSVVTDLKIDKLVPVSANVGRSFYIIAKGLPAANRPTPDLVIGGSGNVILKQEQLRDVNGNPTSGLAPLYLSYTAVRQDVTAIAGQPGLLVFDDTAALEAALSPVDASNPLALGLFFAMINAPGIQVTGLGVDEISADAPFGTVEAFSRAASFLEGKEVYAIAPLSHDPSVHQIFSTHVSVMSGPVNKGERVAIINVKTPTTRADTLIASGSGDRVSGTIFDTNISNLTALVLNAGVSPVGTIPASAGLTLDIATDAKKYSISAISGDQVTIRTSFSPGENDDGYYSTTTLPSGLIQEPFTVSIRGAALTVAGLPDLDGVAETIASVGRGYGSRRLWMTMPDRVAATINGLETVVEGFYAAAAIAGMVGQNPPQQGFTRFPMTGFTRVLGSNDTFNARQMSVMAGGGTWVLMQEAQGAPVISRHALTTDLTSIEVRESSITKSVDFVAKFLRRSLLNYIGRYNVTQGFLDSLSHVIDGLGQFCIESSVILGFSLNLIQQDEDAPDSVIVSVGLEVAYPCNFIKLTLVI